jgi:predicted CXXCH cytochrome family protein
MQCHLEPASTAIPALIRRFNRGPFSYTPGKRLADYFIYLDHAPGTGRDDKFEIASGAYRLRKSACFQRSAMTCQTCHDPHDIPRGEMAARTYVAVCQSCHKEAHRNTAPQMQIGGNPATCLDCHMPRRRAEDAVHVVMTDHYIQRRRPPGDLLAPLEEADFEHSDYRGEVVLSYPPDSIDKTKITRDPTKFVPVPLVRCATNRILTSVRNAGKLLL